ncbi:hypothetical protein [Hazenella coriacea]|uniref:Uncharacterized protein n=1 Tax=Hazenella coriacea TaxID=1179467 RepID=A0A4R3L1F7_9BACL|nr:hypothetical protein [Hazenella coriacea]TCS92204.1 hypothetical protein EDD58_1153 [Hazenella coriacea]
MSLFSGDVAAILTKTFDQGDAITVYESGTELGTGTYLSNTDETLTWILGGLLTITILRGSVTVQKEIPSNAPAPTPASLETSSEKE